MPAPRNTFSLTTTTRYVFVGVIGAICELALFSGLVRIGLGVLNSNFLAFHGAFILCFFLHHHYTYQRLFTSIRPLTRDFLKFAGLMYAQLIIGTLLVWFLIDQLSWVTEVAKVIQIVIVTPISYVVQRVFVFRQGQSV